MFVIALVGPSGSGKTTILNLLAPKLRGLMRNEWSSYIKGDGDIHKERYMDSNRQTIHGHTLNEIDNALVVSKLNYLAGWLNSIRYKQAIGKGLVISDRCPYDVASYVEQPQVLLALAGAIRQDLDRLGILLRTILVSAGTDERRRRVADRLRWDPDRGDYKEGDVLFQDKTAAFFEHEKDVWDETIKSSGIDRDDLKAVTEAITRILARNSSIN